MKRSRKTTIRMALAAILPLAGIACAVRPPAGAASLSPVATVDGVIYADQGQRWTAGARQSFYALDQGSEIMPIAWARSLTAPDGQPFLADRLARYGYLTDPRRAELPIGFSAADRGGTTYLGMTCAACHTRQINVDGTAYRIDGGPALSDFQSFLADLDRAVASVLADGPRFAAFADAVLGAGAPAAARNTLKDDVAAWYHRQHALFSRALPADPWGVGRLDAVSMIFNRVSGLDIGRSADWLIEANVQPADAPVRYPFIWDAPRQDRTQWPGFADNGDVVLAIARNLGEVYGVFADFHPNKDGSLLGYDYHTENSANFDGLERLEGLVRKIGAPVWPWRIDVAAAARGRVLFDRNCGSCHAEQEGALRLFPLTRTWTTPLVDVGSDTRQYDVLARTADTGVLKDAPYGLGKRLGAQDKQFNILAASVIGSMADRFAHHGLPVDALFQPISLPGLVAPLAHVTPQQELAGAYHSDVAEAATKTGAPHRYEARVLHGIWATAPYLHNGSVASLAELLTDPRQRRASFAIGAAYDTKRVGIAAVQPGSPHERRTTGCEDLRSGNSHCGHDYGTKLPASEKSDLLEYLKQL